MICIKKVSEKDHKKYWLNTAYPVLYDDYIIASGCMSLLFGSRGDRGGIIGYNDKPMPSPEWFAEHFALCT